MRKPKLFSSLFVSNIKDDNSLMELVQKGDEEAFNLLFNKYKKNIYNYVLNLGLDQEKAQDITQEVFMTILIKADTFNDSYQFKNWLFTIARNKTIDFYKKKKEITESSMINFDENDSGGSFIDNTQSESLLIEEELIIKSDIEQVNNCLNTLNPRHKEVLILRLFSELSYIEIGEILKEGEKTIKSLIIRAKTNLINCLKNCMEN